jgi:hypothetical protein
MRKLRDEFSRRLMSIPDYRALIALDKAIAEVERTPVRSSSSMPDIQAKPPPEPPKHFSLDASTGHFQSHGNAAIAVLKRNEQPMPLSALLPLVREEGARVNGKDPEINLSSSLSRNERLRSVRYEGRSCWWLADRPFQGEKDFGGTTGAGTPAADKHANMGERHAAPST